MFLHQKFDYHTKLIETEADMVEVERQFNVDRPNIIMFDTETTGLNFMKDKPFFMSFGWGKRVYGADLTTPLGPQAVQMLYRIMQSAPWVMAHNAKYDHHMMTNYGMPIPKEVNYADSQTISRLTNYSDEVLTKSLETMGILYVDETAKFASDVIKHNLKTINTQRRNVAKQVFKAEYPDLSFSNYWDAYKRRIAHVASPYDDVFKRLEELYVEANYYDVYLEKPNLIVNYAYDDIVIMLEWIGKAVSVLKQVDPNLRVFKREAALIRATAKQERIGFKVDIDYLLKSRGLVEAYRDTLYKELREKTGIPDLTVGQHAVIAKMLARKFNISMTSVDNKSLSRIKRGEEVGRIVFLIKKLRTVDKWLSTYIDGFLNRLVDGRVHTSIDLSGAVSGRVSSDMQQQPKEPLKDEQGIELYHPRRAVLADEDYTLYFFDYSQQELRVQAYYTLLCSTGDVKLLRAYMPFKCTSILTGEEFDYKDPKVLARWNSGEWMDENEEIWEKIDVHCITTHTAFPTIPYVSLSNNELNPPEFKKYRKLGKVCNFLKNYQGGIKAIIDQLDVSEEIAQQLDNAYYDSFPVIRQYQRWVVAELHKKGFVEGLYGRRYYMKNSKWFYKAGNYLVQGSSADMVKSVELKVDALLEDTKSAFVMPIHDEIVVRIHKDEMHLIEKIKAIMDDVPEVPWVPMICEVEYTKTNWADKEAWEHGV